MFKMIKLLSVFVLCAMSFLSFGQTSLYNDNAPCMPREIYKGCQGPRCPRPMFPQFYAGDDYFDWTAENYYFYLDNGSSVVTQPTTTKSPWFTENNPNVAGFYSNTKFQDNKPEDGWELVKHKFGTPNDPANNVYGQPTQNPYLVLYNKYTGVIRVFVLVTHTSNSYQQATINLYFLQSNGGQPNYRSAIMEHLSKNSYMNALENFDNQVAKSKVSNVYYNNANTKFWLYADFPMAYDPLVVIIKLI